MRDIQKLLIQTFKYGFLSNIIYGNKRKILINKSLYLVTKNKN